MCKNVSGRERRQTKNEVGRVGVGRVELGFGILKHTVMSI